MLAGEPPFTGPTAQAMIARRFTEPPPSRSGDRPRDVPEAVDQAIRPRRWRQSPADRFAHRGGVRAGAQATSTHRREPFRRRRGPPRAEGRRRSAAARSPPAVPAPRGRPDRRLPPRPRRALRLAPSPWTGAVGATPAPRRLAVLPFENLGATPGRVLRRRDDRRGPRQARRAARPPGHRPQQLGRNTNGATKAAAGDRRGSWAWTTCSPGRCGGRRAPTAEPGAGEPGADPGGRPAPTSGSSRSTRRSPMSSRCRPTSRAGWPRRSTWRSAPAKQQDAGRAAHDEPRGLRRVPQGRRGRPGGLGQPIRPTLRRAAGYYEQAVALDSTFALAWAQLVASASRLSTSSGRRTPGAAGGRGAPPTARSALAPEPPEGGSPWATTSDMSPCDNARALRVCARASGSRRTTPSC